MSTSTDETTELFNSLDESPKCEAEEHNTDHECHADGDEHYVTCAGPCGHGATGIVVMCLKFLLTLHSQPHIAICNTCNKAYPWQLVVRDLGPVNRYKSDPRL